MKIVMLLGWEIGFQKVKFTELLRDELGYDLSEAKSTTDAVLENRPVKLWLQDEAFERIVSELVALGAKVVPEELGV